jgi:uncharacterized membrane protein (DUF485 family)
LLKRLQTFLAWALSALSVGLTLAFYVLLVNRSPWLTSAIFLPFLSQGVVCAVLLLAIMLMSVIVYGWVATAADKSAKLAKRR